MKSNKVYHSGSTIPDATTTTAPKPAAATTAPKQSRSAATAPKQSRSAALLGGTRLVDCTQTISETATIWPGGCPFQREIIVDSRKNGGGYHKQKYTFGCDCGTHVDSPAHWGQPDNKRARAISDLTMEELVAPGCVIDVSTKCSENPDYQLSVNDVKAWEEKYGRIPENALVVMKTGWGKYFNDAKGYTNFDGDLDKGIYKPDTKLGTAGGSMHFPGFHPDTARYLRTERSIVGIGIDTLSLDYGPSTTFGTHCEMLQNNKFQVENMKLDGVPESNLIKDGPEAEARILAIVRDLKVSSFAL